MSRLRTFALSALAFWLLSGPGSVLAQDPRGPALKPLSAVLFELRQEGDFTKAAYLFKRCSGYSLAMSVLLIRSGGDQLNQRATEWRKLAVNLVEYAVDLEIRIEQQRNLSRRKTKDEWEEQTLQVAKEFMNIYIDRMNSNYLRSGNYVIDDPWLTSESPICQEAPKRVMDAIR